MLHVRDGLFSMVRRYTPGVTLAAVSSILRHFHYIFAGLLAISSVMIFQRRMKPSPL